MKEPRWEAIMVTGLKRNHCFKKITYPSYPKLYNPIYKKPLQRVS